MFYKWKNNAKMGGGVKGGMRLRYREQIMDT